MPPKKKLLHQCRTKQEDIWSAFYARDAIINRAYTNANYTL
jgi:hypothetical protein